MDRDKAAVAARFSFAVDSHEPIAVKVPAFDAPPGIRRPVASRSEEPTSRSFCSSLAGHPEAFTRVVRQIDNLH